jgi:hypothetical protein
VQHLCAGGRKTPAQIRAGIAAHEYEKIDLTSLNSANDKS